MAVSYLPQLRGDVQPLPPAVQRRAAVWAASQTLTNLPDAPRDYQQEVLRELLYALGVLQRPESVEVAS